LNYSQISALEQLFNTHPAIQAARTILHGQLLSGGIALKRDGEEVVLKSAFQHHLDEVWIPFAQNVVDSFLKFGYCVVSYEEDDQSLAQQSIKRRRLPGQSESDKVVDKKEPINLIPIVPPTDTYEVAYVMGGRAGYKRNYLVYAMAPNQATKVDYEARITVRQDPDSVGNINSPMATIFDLGSFVSALTELAMTAEITNARPRIWTQMQKESTKGALDPQALFFDSESRGVAASADGEDNVAQGAALAQMHQMMTVINKLQTTHAASSSSGLDHNTRSFSGGTVAQGKSSMVPPEVPPSLFVLPKVRSHLLRNPLYIRIRMRFLLLTRCAKPMCPLQGQEAASSAGQLPQARGDFEALQRLAIEQFGAAFGKAKARESNLFPICDFTADTTRLVLQACQPTSCSRVASPPRARRS